MSYASSKLLLTTTTWSFGMNPALAHLQELEQTVALEKKHVRLRVELANTANCLFASLLRHG